MFDTIKVCILGAVLISVIAGTWAVQNWRWEAKETGMLQDQAIALNKEANKQAKAATKFEKRKAKSDEKFAEINKNLGKSGGSCLSPDSLHNLNTALDHKTAYTR